MSISIEFSNPEAVFYPGSHVAGTVKIDADEPINARKITIAIYGRAYCNWGNSGDYQLDIDGHPGYRWRRSYYHSTVIYTKADATPWVNTTTDEGIAAGHHEHQFQFLLPQHCPPSFEGAHGYIRYTVRVEIDRPWKLDKNNMRQFTVAPTFDLNLIPEAFQPVVGRSQEEVGVILFRHGKIMLEIMLPKAGYVPGEAMVVETIIRNESTRPVISGKLKLVQHSTFIGIEKGWDVDYGPGLMMPLGLRQVKTEEKTLAFHEMALHVASGEEKRRKVTMVVPPTVSSLNVCPIIQVKYLVTMSVEAVGSVHNTVTCSADVLIGTIPLRADADIRPDPPAYDTALPSAPPSYEECMRDGPRTESLETNDGFAPRYPFYSKLSIDQGAEPSAPPIEEKD